MSPAEAKKAIKREGNTITVGPHLTIQIIPGAKKGAKKAQPDHSGWEICESSPVLFLYWRE